MTLLTHRDRQKYSEHGFLVVEGFANASDCSLVQARANELVTGFDPSSVVSIFTTREQNRIADEYFLASANNISFFFEEHAFNTNGTLKQSKEQSINKIGHALHDLDPIFDKFSRHHKIAQLASDLTLTNPVLLQSMYIFKQPRIGGEVSCHQDSSFLYTEPSKILGLWFAIEDATLDNGCLWVLPGGHKGGLKSRWARSANGDMEFRTLSSEPWPEDMLIPLEVKKGSLIVLDGLLPHRSLENRSHKSRHAYTLHLISADANYPSDNWLQRSPSMPLRGF